jgi:DNA-binding transcriptional MocR family regulator
MNDTDYSRFHLQPDTPSPLYQQIADQIAQAILEQKLLPGEHLPPIRTLARLLGVSPITVTLAYRALARAGLAGGQTGRGTFVLPAPTGASLPPAVGQGSAQPGAGSAWEPLPASRGSTPRSVALLQVFTELLSSLPAESQASLIHLSGANPEPSLFSLAHWREIMAEAGSSLDHDSGQPGASALQYGSALGDPALRRFLSGYLQNFGIAATTEEVLLTSGTQQGLDLVARTLFAPGDVVFVEEYSYIAALDIFEQYGVQLRPVPLDEDGLRVEELERVLGARQGRPRFLYTVSTGQSPTGAVLPLERRRRLLEAAERCNLLILEDDPFTDLAYDWETLPPPLAGLTPRGHVIYLRSFSKTTFPAARLGCLVANSTVVAAVAQRKGLVDRGASLLVARTLLAYLSSPAYPAHVDTMRRLYRQRRDALLSALARELEGSHCRWTMPGAGFSLLVTLPPGVDEMQAMATAIARGVVVASGQFFSAGFCAPAAGRDPVLRLTFGNRSPEQLEEGVRRLAAAIRDLRERGPALPLASGPLHVVTDV